MKAFVWAILATVILFLITIFVVEPIISNIGYQSVEVLSSSNACTYCYTIFTVSYAPIIVENMNIGKK